MRILKIMLTILVLGALVLSLASCGSQADEAELSENQVVTVQSGDLTTDITAAGNLALSRTEDLAFEIAGTVEEVLVEEGDVVEEGQVLARLDTSEWEDQLKALEDQLTAAEREVTAAEREVTAAERQVAAKICDLLQAQINLKTAENNLEEVKEPYTEEDISNAETAVDEAEYSLEFAQWKLDRAVLLREKMSYELEVFRAEQNLDTVQQDLETMLSGPDEDSVAIAEMQVEIAQARLEDAQMDVEDAQQDVEDAQMDVEDAQNDVKDAQEELDEALNTSPEITAPFDGFVTMVNVNGGDEVLKGTVAVTIADPNKFEADILVSEMDILQVKLGGEAWVQVDAMSGLTLPAEVTHISPTATIQSGVVNYEVKVEIESLEAATQERQQVRQEAMEGELSEHLKQAIEEGQITQEQAEEMIKQMQQAQGTEQGQVPTMIPEDFQLREGLTGTVSIIIEERNDVLLVPNGAITSQGGQAYVKVVSPDGVTEERTIKTGLSDWHYTEVTDGLVDGEQVLVPQGTTTTPTTQQGPPGGIMPIPGMGRPH
ncbi:efflux RND transporter periplasmic adaptor subunit [Chloroflexota bacterium]